MNPDQRTAKIVGGLIILALASSMMSSVFLESANQDNPDYLDEVSVNEPQVLIGVLLLATLTASVVCIPIVMFPIFKRYNESLALGYVGARIFEGITDSVMAISMLLLVLLSREFVNTGSTVTPSFQISGALILALFEWISVLENIPYCFGVLMFSYLLYQSKLVPRWLAVWGLIGGALLLARIPLSMFVFDPLSTTILAIPIMVNELVLAGWLIGKGFNSSNE
jgi:hypothetical protein